MGADDGKANGEPDAHIAPPALLAAVVVGEVAIKQLGHCLPGDPGAVVGHLEQGGVAGVGDVDLNFRGMLPVQGSVF